MANGDFRLLAERQYTCYHVEPMLLSQQSPPRLVCLGEAVVFLANMPSRSATRLQKITASERRTYVPKVSAIWLEPPNERF